MSLFSESPFSWTWVWISMGVFITFELVLGGFLAHVVFGRMLSLHLNFLLQGLLNLVSYFLGGLLVGILSPRVRIQEPAVGAFLSVAVMLSLSLFTPYSFIRFGLFKMLIGGAIAFMLALTGAKLGERLTGHLARSARH